VEKEGFQVSLGYIVRYCLKKPRTGSRGTMVHVCNPSYEEEEIRWITEACPDKKLVRPHLNQ
jgi:hypothetical protein